MPLSSAVGGAYWRQLGRENATGDRTRTKGALIVGVVIALSGLGFAANAGAATTWVRSPAPNPSPTSNLLRSVSCSSPTACTAVGLQRPPGNTSQSPFIAQTTNGTTWTQQVSPAPGNFARTLAVSCAVVDHCFATGDWSGARPANQLRALVLKET